MRNFLSFLMLLLWLSLGAWFFTCQVMNLCIEPKPMPVKVAIKAPPSKVELIDPKALKKAYNSVFTAEEDLTLQKSKAEVIFSESFPASLDEIAFFLKKHTKTRLTITGNYAKDEVNESAFPDLGIARAEQIKEQFEVKGVNAQQLILQSSVGEGLFDENGRSSNNDVIDFRFSENYEELNETDVKAAFKALRKVQKEAIFSRNDKEITISERVDKAIDDIVFYLNRNKDQGLDIEIDYEDKEDSGLEGQDIGLLRAYFLKKKYIEKGILKDKVTIASNKDFGIFEADNKAKVGAIRLNFIFPDKTDEAKLIEMQLEKALEKELSNKTLLANEENLKNENIQEKKEAEKEEKQYADASKTPPIKSTANDSKKQKEITFGFGSDQISVSSNLQKYVNELKAFLAKYPDKSVTIIGHTCNLGDEQFNLKLGQNRAEAAKKLLTESGIYSSKLVVKSKGEYVPAYDNTTREGRARNRRVEIDIH